MLIREAELAFAPGLNVITGETGAGKTILAQAIGLLLGAKGDAALRRRRRRRGLRRGRVRPARRACSRRRRSSRSRELRPDDEEGVVLARRIFAEGRTRAYAWGRSAAREDVAALGERLLAMSGQFEQRRLARPAYQLAVLDAFCGDEQLRRRAEARVGVARARAPPGAGTRSSRATRPPREARLAELRALVEDTDGLEPGREDALREERERLRHVDRARSRERRPPRRRSTPTTARERRARRRRPSGRSRRVERLAPGARRRRRTSCATPSCGCARRRARCGRSCVARGRPGPPRAGRGASSTGSPRRGAASAARRYEELLARAAEARTELEALEEGADPVAAAEQALARAEARVRELADGAARRARRGRGAVRARRSRPS